MTVYRNRFAAHKNTADKLRDYQRDCRLGAMAYMSDNTFVPLNQVKLANVEFIAGLWRVQDPFPYKIQDVRDKQLVLHEKLPHIEKNLFEFYSAFVVTENCYGRYLSASPDTIVAKYTTDHGTYWSYGKTIEQARAFLGIRLYDEYMDLIHSHACKNQLARQKK